MISTFARRQEQPGLVSEQQKRDLITAACGGDSQRRRNFSGELPLGPMRGAKLSGAGNVEGQNERQFTFFPEPLYEGSSHPVGDIPIDIPHLVARDVLAQFLKIHAASLEMTEVSADH